MKKLSIGHALLALVAVVLIFGVGAPALAQTPTPTLTPTLTPTPVVRNYNTLFIPATEACKAVSSTTGPVIIRTAANNWALSRTAAGAETISFHCDLGSALMARGLLAISRTGPGGTPIAGDVKIVRVSVAHQITVAALTSNTLNKISKTTYSHNTANAVADFGGTLTGTLPTATQTNPYLTRITLGTPAFLPSGANSVGIDWTAVMADTGVYSVFGIAVDYVKTP